VGLRENAQLFILPRDFMRAFAAQRYAGGHMKMDPFALSAVRKCLTMGLAVSILGGCHRRRGREPDAPLTIQLTSADIRNGTIPKALSCDGQGASPQLSWSAPPAGTRSLALVVTDRDSPFGFNFVHWVLYNMPPSARDLPGNVPPTATLPDGSEQGANDNNGKLGYTPPCPPAKSLHRYDFVLYALDEGVALHSATKEQLLGAIQGHVLAMGELVGKFGR
jgi:Raf kinase inhibitor-like YbhB/YbcL family protein